MQFDYVSDTHIDFHCKQYSITHKNFHSDIERYVNSLLPSSPSDTLIIAGDIGHRFEQDSYFLLKLRETYKDILIVPGNHCRFL